MIEFKRLYDAFVGVNETVGVNQTVEFEKNSVEHAKTFVKKYNVTLLLKGPTTYVVSRGDTRKSETFKDSLNNKIKNDIGNNDISNDVNIRISAIDRGSPGMATAGSGDVLSGIITGFLGYIEDEFDSARVSAFVNGMAGELAAKDEGEISMTSSDTIKHISEAMKLIKG
jgi:NAD(P)H-hydrate repair Nnr-like enzyme with NAD(P)H-hydrate dehydratase domain